MLKVLKVMISTVLISSYKPVMNLYRLIPFLGSRSQDPSSLALVSQMHGQSDPMQPSVPQRNIDDLPRHLIAHSSLVSVITLDVLVLTHCSFSKAMINPTR